MASSSRRNTVEGRPAVSSWLAAGTLMLALACLLGLVVLGQRLVILQEELERMRRELSTMMPCAPTNNESSGIFAKVQRMEELIPPLATVTEDSRPDPSPQSLDLAREKRETGTGKKQSPKKKRSVVHLVPASLSSSDEKDQTEIAWKAFLSQGNALEVKGKAITVEEGGLYLIYSQVLYRDTTFVMGHTVTRSPGPGEGQAEVLLRCIQSMPPSEEMAHNSCYSGGVFKLHKGDVIKLLIPRVNAYIDMSPNATFLGLVKL